MPRVGAAGKKSAQGLNWKSVQTKNEGGWAKYALIVYDRGRAYEFVDVWIALALQLSHIALRVFDDRPHPGTDAPTDVPDRLQARHLIADSWFSREQVILVRAQPLSVERHHLRERRQLRG